MSHVHVTAIPVVTDGHLTGYTIECTICGPVTVAADEPDATAACCDHLTWHGVPLPHLYRPV